MEIQNGTFKMYGGTNSDNYEENAGSNYGGGGVCAHTSGTFTMYGGIISDNQSVTDAGGVTVVGGRLGSPPNHNDSELPDLGWRSLN